MREAEYLKKYVRRKERERVRIREYDRDRERYIEYIITISKKSVLKIVKRYNKINGRK